MPTIPPHTSPTKLVTAAIGLLLIGAIAVPALLNTNAFAGGGVPAANKVAVSGSTIEELTAQITEGDDVVQKTVLSTTMKTSSTDLLLQVTAECALWTQTVTVGNDLSQANAQVKLYVLFDGEVVRTTNLDDSLGDENGKIVFCDRTQESETSRFENDNATIRNYLATRTANAFNWVVVDAEPGTHTIEVVAELSASVMDVESEGAAELPGDNGLAQAAIGQRTLVIEPIKLANGADI